MKHYRLAAPSWVIPGTVRDNCLFLEHRVDEAALLFLETESCLAYDGKDLPRMLAGLDLAYHAHLPADLPWRRGGEAVAGICLALMDKVAFLGARRAVLHPPARSGQGAEACIGALVAFAGVWERAGRRLEDVFLENVRENDLSGLDHLFAPGGFGLCPDLGHVLAYGQYGVAALAASLPEGARPRMLHCSAPGTGMPGGFPKSAHCPLDMLDDAGVALGSSLCAALAADAVIVAELFDWVYVERSLPVIARWLDT